MYFQRIGAPFVLGRVHVAEPPSPFCRPRGRSHRRCHRETGPFPRKVKRSMTYRASPMCYRSRATRLAGIMSLPCAHCASAFASRPQELDLRATRIANHQAALVEVVERPILASSVGVARRSRRTRHDCGAPAGAEGTLGRQPAPTGLGLLMEPAPRCPIRSARCWLIIQPAWCSI